MHLFEEAVELLHLFVELVELLHLFEEAIHVVEEVHVAVESFVAVVDQDAHDVFGRIVLKQKQINIYANQQQKKNIYPN